MIAVVFDFASVLERVLERWIAIADVPAVELARIGRYGVVGTVLIGPTDSVALADLDLLAACT